MCNTSGKCFILRCKLRLASLEVQVLGLERHVHIKCLTREGIDDLVMVLQVDVLRWLLWLVQGSEIGVYLIACCGRCLAIDCQLIFLGAQSAVFVNLVGVCDQRLHIYQTSQHRCLA
jgi:hypothetical protein